MTVLGVSSGDLVDLGGAVCGCCLWVVFLMLCFVESIVFQCLLVFGFFCMMFSSLVFGVRGSIPQFRTIDVPETVSCHWSQLFFDVSVWSLVFHGTILQVNPMERFLTFLCFLPFPSIPVVVNRHVLERSFDLRA